MGRETVPHLEPCSGDEYGVLVNWTSLFGFNRHVTDAPVTTHEPSYVSRRASRPVR